MSFTGWLIAIGLLAALLFGLLLRTLLLWWRAKLSADEMWKSLSTIAASAIALVSAGLAFAQAADTAEQTEVMREQTEILRQQVAVAKGALHYRADRNAEWRIELSLLRDDTYLPRELALVPTFELDDGSYRDGDLVTIEADRYHHSQGEAELIVIDGAKDIVCAQQAQLCEEALLVRITIKIQRDGDEIFVPVFRRD